MNHGKQRFDRCSDEHHCPNKMPHFDAYESMGKLADIGYHCVEISQVPMTAENVAGFRKAIDELGLNVSSCTASTSPMLPGMPGEFLCNPDDYKKIVEDCRKLDWRYAAHRHAAHDLHGQLPEGRGFRQGSK